MPFELACFPLINPSLPESALVDTISAVHAFLACHSRKTCVRCFKQCLFLRDSVLDRVRGAAALLFDLSERPVGGYPY